MTDNPFIERGRITNPAHFVGRWRELSILFDRVEARRPVMLTGVGGIGKSSLLTHVVQAAAANLDNSQVAAFYLNLDGAISATQIYHTLSSALQSPGDTQAALELALIESGRQVIVCLDNAHAVVAQPWGEQLLESLARMARTGGIMLVVALSGAEPVLSERFARISLGAFQASEVRLLVEAYLEEAAVSFSPAELAALTKLSAGHPAYLQRAAFHLFRAKREPHYNWRAAYLAEARELPVPGAPLPPSAFEGDEDPEYLDQSRATSEQDREPQAPPRFVLPAIDASLLVAILVLVGLIAALAGQVLPGLALAAGGLVLAVATQRR
jgi:hypothetical protein